MILLKTNQVNQFAVTVKELKTLPSPNYLFSFYNQQKNKDYLVYLPISNASSRFDLFFIELPVNIDLPTGGYIYKIYQSDNLDLSIGDKLLLEQGRLEVVKEFPKDKHYTLNNINQVNYVN